MRIIRSIKSLKVAIRQHRRQNKTIGFVPTMGALHEGHLSLIRRCRLENDVVIVSIFVNPTQFSPSEDFSSYPRQLKQDKLLTKKEKVDILFYPSNKGMYPTSFLTFVKVNQLSEQLCGQSRPTHFQGVTTIVAKLLNLTTPDRLYLGQKDAQQAVILKKMIADLNFNVSAIICPTVREPDGLAMSSRNSYLSAQERKEAPVLYQSLKEAKHKILSGQRSPSEIIRFVRSEIGQAETSSIDYIACVDADTLTPLNILRGRVMLALAVRFGKTRLIDNIVFRVS